MTLHDQIKATYNAFDEEATKFANGNKSAGARARKHSLELGNLCKAFRKESVASSK